MPPCEELRGDSPSGLAANAPVSLGFELTFLSEFKWIVWRVLDRAAKRRACISQAPAKVPFEVYNGFLLEFNSKIVYNKENNYSCYCEGILWEKDLFGLYVYLFCFAW